jgi:hypothetical protein
LGVKIFPGFGIYFWVAPKKSKNNGNNSVASPFGLRSCLRQSGGRCAAGLDAGLKPRFT